jgi:hypothetical protein
MISSYKIFASVCMWKAKQTYSAQVYSSGMTYQNVCWNQQVPACWNQQPDIQYPPHPTPSVGGILRMRLLIWKCWHLLISTDVVRSHPALINLCRVLGRSTWQPCQGDTLDSLLSDIAGALRSRLRKFTTWQMTIRLRELHDKLVGFVRDLDLFT